jgi:flagellar basal body-associated protein FliL
LRYVIIIIIIIIIIMIIMLIMIITTYIVNPGSGEETWERHGRGMDAVCARHSTCELAFRASSTREVKVTLSEDNLFQVAH